MRMRCPCPGSPLRFGVIVLACGLLPPVAAAQPSIPRPAPLVPNAAWVRFECGPFFNHHQHYEVGNFEIYRYQRLATESGEYVDYGSNHSVNWLIRTVAHNCMLVYMPGETWPVQRDGGRNKYANDGGQVGRFQWPVQTLEQWKAKADTFERGRIIAYENQGDFLYVAADCTRAYNPAKLSLWTRSILFLRPHTFVIFDRVTSSRPEYEKTWLLHCFSQPRIDGSTTMIQNGKGRLAVQTLLPEKPLLRAVKGYTYHGQTFDEQKSALSTVANLWRLEVAPSSQQREDVFLHVLSTTDEPAKATLLRSGGRIGVEIGTTQVTFGTGGEATVRVRGRAIALGRVVKGKFE